MKKKLLGIATLAALMTLSAGITAFAGWETDAEGETVFRNSKGNIVYAGWVTDPDTGYEYYMDPDGHIMRGTTVEGYWLDDDGIKHEKSDAQIRAEENRAAREAAYNTPAKEAKAVSDIANEAKSTGVAASTTRREYQSEMYTLSNSIFNSMQKDLDADSIKSLKGATSKTNVSDKFYYYNKDGLDVISSDMPKAVEGTDEYYEYALDLHYNRNIVHDEAAAALETGFQKLLVAALGEVQGNMIYEQMAAQTVGDDEAAFNYNGYTDTGNPYSVRYATNNIYVYVTCSEIVPEPEPEEVIEEAAEGETEAVIEGAEAAAEEYIADVEAGDVVISGEAEEQLEEEITDEVIDEVIEEAEEYEEYVEE